MKEIRRQKRIDGSEYIDLELTKEEFIKYFREYTEELIAYIEQSDPVISYNNKYNGKNYCFIKIDIEYPEHEIADQLHLKTAPKEALYIKKAVDVSEVGNGKTFSEALAETKETYKDNQTISRKLEANNKLLNK